MPKIAKELSALEVKRLSSAGMHAVGNPARFERATYALEEFVATGMCIYFNGLQHKNSTV